MKTRMDTAAESMRDISLAELVKVDEASGLRVLPHWLAQPYFRPSPPTAQGKGSKDASKVVKDVTNAANLDTTGLEGYPVKRPLSPILNEETSEEDSKRIRL